MEVCGRKGKNINLTRKAENDGEWAKRIRPRTLGKERGRRPRRGVRTKRSKDCILIFLKLQILSRATETYLRQLKTALIL